MKQEQQNIYARARAASGLSQEAAAEVLELSTRSVADYEAGRVVPTNQTVAAMMEAYGTDWLGVKHVQETSRMLNVLPDELRVRDMSSATIQVINRALLFTDNFRELLEITEDSVIDEQERPRFDDLMAQLDALVSAAIEFKISAKKERPEAATSKRSAVSRGVERKLTRNIIAGSPELSRGNFGRAVAR